VQTRQAVMHSDSEQGRQISLVVHRVRQAVRVCMQASQAVKHSDRELCSQRETAAQVESILTVAKKAKRKKNCTTTRASAHRDAFARQVKASSRPVIVRAQVDVRLRGGRRRLQRCPEVPAEVQPVHRIVSRVKDGPYTQRAPIRPQLRIPTARLGGKRYVRTSRAAKAAGTFVCPPGIRPSLFRPAPLGSRAVDPDYIALDDPVRLRPDGEVTVWMFKGILSQHPPDAQWFMPQKDKNRLQHAIAGNTTVGGTTVARWGKS
jgi:hypothetical protein